MKKNSITDIHQYLRDALGVRKTLSTFGAEDQGIVEEKKHKEYERMPFVQLTEYEGAARFTDVLQKRTSTKNSTHKAAGADDLSLILGVLKIRADGSRTYPSGGAKYPVEVYVVGTVGEYVKGVFHYNPSTNTLEHLWPLSSVYAVNEIFGVTATEETAYAIIFTSVWGRTSQKYGDFGYQLALIEAGHMGQNVLLAAAACGVGARPFCGYNDDVLADVLDLDIAHEQVVYSIQVFA